MKLGSLFSGFGGLDMAIEEVFGARTVWNSDIEPGPRKVLAHRFPGVPNLGDITAVDWSKVEPVDIIAGGSPCQDISSAGRMAGMREGTRSNLWVEMREAIRALQPTYVIWENVRGALSTPAASAMESDPRLLGDHPNGQPVLRALGRVLGDLAKLGFDAEWHGLLAGCKRHSVGTCRECVGAPHGRARFFVVAAHPERVARGEWRIATPRQAAGVRPLGADPRRDRAPITQLGIAVQLLPTPSVADATGGHERRGGKRGDELLLKGIATHQAWGPYAAAIARWEAIVGPAPAPTKPCRTGRPKLNPAFAEWMMGAPAGWITNTPGVTDTEALRMAGNGVVRQQAVAALRLMLNRMETYGAETRSPCPCQKRDQP